MSTASAAPSVPIVLPLVSVQLDEAGIATVLVDNIPHDAAEPVHRDAVERVVHEIAENLGPVRVRVTESDGSEFTDVILPKPSGDQPRASAAAEPGLAGEGFLPDELVDIAVIVAQQTADGDGHAHLRLPPALLADIGGSRPPRTRIRGLHSLRNAMNPRGRPVDDELVNLGLLLIGCLGALTAVLRAAGSLAAWASGAGQPEGGLTAGFDVLRDPAHPDRAFASAGLSTAMYWATAATLFTFAFGAAWLAWRLISGIRQRAARDPRRLVGVATSRDVSDTASKKALLARAKTLRPSLTRPHAHDVGYLLGRSRGQEVWSSVEDSTLILGPPRSGKGLHLVINAILDAPGAVITTATRPDNIAATLRARERIGPVAVFDPQHLAEGLPSGLRWSPVRGCEDPLTAMIRATGLAAATGLSSGGVESGGFWEGKTRTALQALLHAAALDRRTPRELFHWTTNAPSASDAVAILASHPAAAHGWADALESMVYADPRTRDSIWVGVSLAMSCLADPRVLDAVSPGDGEEFDPKEFLTNNGTLYLLATGAGAGASWSLVAAFIEDLVETARHLAAASPGARLDPPLLLALDEIGNLAPLPSLPVLMAEGGGTGITTMPILQSLSQARDKWGDHAAGAIWDASIVKVILGGTSAARDLQDLSALIGERDERTDTISVGDYGSRSLQRSTRRVPVMPPETIRTLPFGTGLVLLRNSPPLVTDLRPWTTRKDAGPLSGERAWVEQTLRLRQRHTPNP